MKTRTRKSRKTRARYRSRLTSKYQATIPKEVRDRLRLKSGDDVIYELLPDNTVILRKPSSLDLEYLRSLNTTLNEWSSSEDERAYNNL